MKKIGFTMGVGGGGGGSTEYTQAEKTKLAGIEAGATVGATAAQAAKLTELEGSIGNVVNGTTPVKLASALTETKVSDTYEYGTTARTTATTYAGCEIDKIYGKAVVVGEGDSARVDGCTPKQKVIKDANGVVKHTIEMPKSLVGEYITLYGIGSDLNTAHDYIDWNRKVVVRKIGRVKLKDLTWQYYAGVFSSNKVFNPSLNIKLADYNSAMCMSDNGYPCCKGANYMDSWTYGIWVSANDIMIKESAYSSIDAFTAALGDKYLYFELATPYEEPILCSSSVHEVVAGGTETMVYVGASPTVVSEYSGSADAMKLHTLEPDKLLTREEANRTYIKMGGVHETVDLGLPSGTLWAKCNLGATSETEAGDYYGWGMTEPYRIGIDSTDSYASSSASQITTDLPPCADASYIKWGIGWSIPTKEQFEELLANTTNELTTIGGVNGIKFTASNGKWVFLARIQYYLGTSIQDTQMCRYWSKTYFSESQAFRYSEGITKSDKCYGYPIRPVYNRVSND